MATELILLAKLVLYALWIYLLMGGPPPKESISEYELRE